MKVVEIKILEDCFDGTSMREILLDQPITSDFIKYFEHIARLQYFPDFARPFFKADNKEHFSVKGIEGNCTLRAVLVPDIDNNCAYLTKFIENFGKDHSFLHK